MASLPAPKLTEDEYLRIERAAETKSEFVDGEMVAMPGGTDRHSLLASSCNAALRTALRVRRCRVYNSDLRIRTAASGAYVYPDVSVVCGQPEFHDATNDVLINPILIIEVLSPSTEDYDHNRKFALYREIPSLRDYLMVHAREPLVEHFSRQPGSWNYREYVGLDESVALAEPGCALALRDIYVDIDEFSG